MDPYWLHVFLLRVPHSHSLTTLICASCVGTPHLLWALLCMSVSIYHRLWVYLLWTLYFYEYDMHLKTCGVFPTCPPTAVSPKVMLLIDIELAYMNTNHEDFIGFAK